VILRRRPFGELIRRQLDLFQADHAGLIRQLDRAERAYDDADRDEAEERYGDYVDLLDTGIESLARTRDSYAATLDEEAAEAYADEFNRAVLKRFKRFAIDVEDS
jgi:hypothetical protein